MTSVSIIICTRDRPAQLAETLVAVGRVRVPPQFAVELVVVDNGAVEQSTRVVDDVRPNLPVRVLREPRAGQDGGYNTAVTACATDILLFTDDDVAPPLDWIAGMCEPIVAGRADAVAGGVRLAPHLHRAWMEPMHRTLLASTELTDPVAPRALTGANMAISRRIFERVIEFDTELGPGALGGWGETLFSYQLLKAGFRFAAALDVVVEHRPDPDRITRAAYADEARKKGRSEAYVAYHWKHVDVRHPAMEILKKALRLIYWRIRRAGQWRHPEGMALWEYELLHQLHHARQYRMEARRPRNYEQFGLLKRKSRREAQPVPAESY